MVYNIKLTDEQIETIKHLHLHFAYTSREHVAEVEALIVSIARQVTEQSQ